MKPPNAVIHDLAWLATWLKLTFAEFQALLEQDYLGGYIGEPTGIDGKVLYAIVRTLKPQRLLEIGTAQGGTAGHIALALKHNYEDYDIEGHLLTVDIDNTAGLYNMPQFLRDYATSVHADANLYIEQLSEYDFIHEDGNHSAYQIHKVYQRVQSGLLAAGGVILSHDALMFSDIEGMDSIGEYIHYGIRSAGLTFPPVEYLHCAPSPCGYTLYRRE